MKKIILLTIFLVVFQMYGFSQTNSIKDYGSTLQDTIFYLKDNFETNKHQYLGKKVECLLNDYNLPFEDVSSFGDSYETPNAQFYGFYMSFIPYRRSIELMKRGFKNFTVLLILDIENVPLEKHLQAIVKIEEPKDKAYYFKEYIIRDIILTPK